MTNELIIFSAGCVSAQAQACAKQFEERHPPVRVTVRTGGSVDLIRKVRAGDRCDLLLSADHSLVERMLLGTYADGYLIFAGNRMVLVSMDAQRAISDSSWIETVLDPGVTLGHFDPFGDPGGYRAVMACMLADSVQPGLSAKLLEHPGRFVVRSMAERRPNFMFSYYSGALKMKLPFAALPRLMDLSDPALEQHYQTAVIDLDGDGKNIVRGSAISHAMAIPLAAQEANLAQEYAGLFLETDFVSQGFVGRHRCVGHWGLENNQKAE